MRTFTFGLTCLMACIVSGSSAAEEVHWSSPGWYVIIDLVEDGWIESGPFGSREQCDAARPPDEPQNEATFYCQYLDRKPAWDY